MSDILKAWLGKRVTVTLNSTVPVKIRGVLTQGDAAFLALDQGRRGLLLIPVPAVLHVDAEDAEPSIDA